LHAVNGAEDHIADVHARPELLSHYILAYHLKAEPLDALAKQAPGGGK